MRREKATDYDGQLEWFLMASASALGERGTLGAVVNVLERGGSASSETSFALTDEQLGWGHTVHGDVERSRDCFARWVRLAPEHQQVLGVHYSTAAGRFTSLVAALGKLAAVALWLAAGAGERSSAHRRTAELYAGSQGAAAPVSGGG